MFDSQFAPGKYQTVGTYPIEPATTSPMFPPVCLKSHWDPTAISRMTLIERAGVPMPTLQEPMRPSTRICMQYVTSGPAVNEPVARADAVDRESELRRLDRPLGIHESKQYLPPMDSDMYTYKKISLPRQRPDAGAVSELEVPSALLRDHDYKTYMCREVDDRNSMYMQKTAGQMFGYSSKLEKYRVFAKK
jgi:hypothetical protein